MPALTRTSEAQIRETILKEDDDKIFVTIAS